MYRTSPLPKRERCLEPNFLLNTRNICYSKRKYSLRAFSSSSFHSSRPYVSTPIPPLSRIKKHSGGLVRKMAQRSREKNFRTATSTRTTAPLGHTFPKSSGNSHEIFTLLPSVCAASFLAPRARHSIRRAGNPSPSNSMAPQKTPRRRRGISITRNFDCSNLPR